MTYDNVAGCFKLRGQKTQKPVWIVITMMFNNISIFINITTEDRWLSELSDALAYTGPFYPRGIFKTGSPVPGVAKKLTSLALERRKAKPKTVQDIA